MHFQEAMTVLQNMGCFHWKRSKNAFRFYRLGLFSVFSPDGKYALSGSSKNLTLYDVSTGRVLRIFSGHANYISSVSFSPDGKYILSGSYDNTLKLWDVSSGKELKTFSGHQAEFILRVFLPMVNI